MGMKILLPLKSEFYLMIEREKKTEEYRAIAPHWITRLVKKPFVDLLKDSLRNGFGLTWQKDEYNENLVGYIKTLVELNGADAVFKDFDSIVFSYGYTKRHMEWECKGLRIGFGNPDWGAEKGKKYFVFELGGRIY